MKTILKYYKKHKILFIGTILSTFSLAGLDILFPYLVQLMISQDFLNSQEQNRYMMFLFLGSIIVLRSITVWIRNYWGSSLGINIEFDMRNDLFKKINTLPFSYFDNNKTGTLMSRVVSDISEISKITTEIPRDLLLIPITLVGAIIVMLMLNLKLGLVVLFMMPILIFFTYYKNRIMRQAYLESKHKIANLNSQLEDSFSGIRVVKAFNNETYEEKKFNNSNHAFKEVKKRAFKALADLRSVSNFFSGILQTVVIAYGIYLVQYEAMPIEILIAFVLYINRFMRPIRSFITLTETYQKGLVGIIRFQELIDIKDNSKDEQQTFDITNIKGRVRLRDVSFSYEKENQEVLKSINLSVSPKEHIALVGGTGSGKSTLCSLLMKFYENQKGKILIDDIDINKINTSSLRQHIGIVQQDIFLFNGTIKENIQYGKLHASDEEIIEASKKSNIHEFIMSLPKQYNSYVGEKGIKLSGGQKQQLSIARIFLKNPTILILDEATSALDNITENKIQQALDTLSKNRTVITIAHRLSTLKNVDKIFVLKIGEIIEEGTHKELLEKKGEYKRLYDLQFNQEKEN